MSKQPNEGLTDTEVGLIDALMTMLETLIAHGVSPATLAQSFEAQRDGHLRQNRGEAAAILELFRQYAANPEIARAREIHRIFREEPPRGSA